MKTSKVLVTLAATAAVVLSTMTPALAAPQAASTCPTKNLLNQMISNGTSSPTTGTSLQSLLGQASLPGTAPSGTTCPKTQAAQQQLANLTGYNTVPTAAKCPKAQAAQQQLGNLTGTGTSAAPTATPAPTATTAPAPTATPAPTTGTTTGTPAPVSGNMSADESKMINLVNQDRASNGGLKALTFDASLRAGALTHSQDMSTNNYFSHTSPTLGDYATRLKASGVQYSSAGENIAMYPSVDQAEVGFMNSAGHRANILGDYTRVGIGIVYNSSKGMYYITQWFAK